MEEQPQILHSAEKRFVQDDKRTFVLLMNGPIEI
jgi:hypothetical protein